MGLELNGNFLILSSAQFPLYQKLRPGEYLSLSYHAPLKVDFSFFACWFLLIFCLFYFADITVTETSSVGPRRVSYCFFFL